MKVKRMTAVFEKKLWAEKHFHDDYIREDYDNTFNDYDDTNFRWID